MSTLPDIKDLRRYFNYSPTFGKLHWRRDHYRRKVGDPAGCLDAKGYVTMSLLGKRFFAHRAIYLMHKGSIPEDRQIDHINGIRDDNRIENLRLATPLQNQMNKRPHKNNTSGITGVSFHKRSNKWTASIRVNGKAITLGYYEDIADAAAARKKAEKEHGYHRNHGRVLPRRKFTLV